MNKEFTSCRSLARTPNRFLCVYLLIMTSFLPKIGSCQPLPLHWPLTTSAPASGSFGELRGNHIHSGIDLKTGGQEFVPVRAAADGFVSRIKVSHGGYGKALYITHDDGITTVYGHLSEFYDPVADTVLASQYLKQQFETEIFPASSRFRVKRGQVIGFSGNTGSSQGPHLHFETRHTASEIPFDPVYAGVLYRDTVPPVIEKALLYKPGKYGWLYGAESRVLKLSAVSDTTAASQPVPGTFFIGLSVKERANGSESKLGVREITVELDGNTVFRCKIDSFSFDETASVKAMTDPLNPGVMLCLRVPGNKLPFYPSGSGLLNVPDSKPALLKITVTDNYGNQAFAKALLHKDPSDHITAPAPLDAKSSAFELFEPIDIRVTESGKKTNKKLIITPTQAVFRKPASIPFEKLRKLKLKPEQILIMKKQADGTYSTAASKTEDGKLLLRATGGGEYILTADTTSPKSGTLTFAGYDLRGNLIYEIPFTEKLSGLRSSVGLLGNRWVLTGFYTNKDVISLMLAPDQLTSSREFVLTLEDRCGNKSVSTYLIEVPAGNTGQ